MCIYNGQSYSDKLIFYFTKLLDDISCRPLQNDPNCRKKHLYPTQEVF